jgi:hypothetical protein
MKAVWGGVALATVLGAGCSNPVAPGFLAREWTESLREQQVHALFPPREDVRVGDIYLLALPTDYAEQWKRGEFLPVPILFGSASPTIRTRPGQPSLAETHYAQRPGFPPSNQAVEAHVAELAKKRGGTEAPVLTVPVPSSQGSIFTAERSTVRLRQVAFPDFAKASVRGGSLAALIPIDVIMPGLGLTGESAESVTLSVPVAESYGVPAGDLLARFAGTTGSGGSCVDLTTINKAWTPDFILGVAQSLGDEMQGSSVQAVRSEPSHDAYLVVMTEVFYARTFDVRIDLSRQAAAALKASLPSTGAVASTGSGTGTGGEQPAPPAETTPPTTAAERATRVAANANALSEKLSSPGVSATIYLADTGSVGLRRTYAQPIAIGYRGVALRVAPRVPGAGAHPECSIKFASLPSYQTPGGPVAYPMSSGRLKEPFK